ncbi:hypothetical protein ACFST9_18825 [Hymenobacter monticola]|uniref:Uncharacterized protein n=1 Tax=Hymenobacter monticola TaxID=1705399 RepID=A0ABY4AZT9_9BACT|nr:hypothetical protein [Hymenobacter monticola]UOE32039.1 hypothetical protein MTP16_12940 [Hymenobacter monticola]
MKHLTFSALLLGMAMLTSCDSTQSQKIEVFNQAGITFQHPGNWSADDADRAGPNAVTVTCQKSGLDESGLITVSCFNDSLDLDEVQNIFHNQLDSTSLYKLAGVKFSSAGPGRFGPHHTLQSQFSMSMLGVPHTGWLDAFHYKNHTFMVLRQQADEDSVKNRKGFALITQTLDVKPGK